MLSSLQHVFLLQDLSEEDCDHILPLLKTRTYKRTRYSSMRMMIVPIYIFCGRDS